MEFEVIVDKLREINIYTTALKLMLSIVIAGIIGLERNKQGRAAGMRTHILVCLGATLTSLLGFYAIDVLGYEGTEPLRAAAQVISGIGFLGVGTILLKGRFQITGLTTAAGLWAVGAIGIALGAGFYEGAIIAAILAITTITVIGKLEGKINKKYSRFGIYIEIDSTAHVRSIIDFLDENLDVTDIQVTTPRSGTVGNVGIEANINNQKVITTPNDVAKLVEKQPEVVFALESI